MSQDEHTHQGPSYMSIFWILAVLMGLEVGVTFLHIGPVLMGALLVGMAVGKAILVALYFMHLKFEKTTLSLIAITPMVICVFLTVMLYPDITWSWRP